MPLAIHPNLWDNLIMEQTVRSVTMTTTAVTTLTKDTPTTWWETAEASANGPAWLGIVDNSWTAPADWTGTQQEWLESNGWQSYESEEEFMESDESQYFVMLAPANDRPDGVYGIYFDSNPSWAFPRELVPTILTMDIDEAQAWLNARTYPSHWGSPTYVYSDAEVTTRAN